MKDTANSAGKQVPSFDLTRCVFPRISAEEWEALGISPSKAREIEKQGEMEKQADAEQAKQRHSALS